METDYDIDVKSEYFNDNKDTKQYTWDFNNIALEIAGTQYSFYSVYDQNQLIGKFAFQPKNKYLAQFYIVSESKLAWKRLFEAIYSVSEEVKINNIDSEYVLIKTNLIDNGLINHISQYEMGMDL